MTETNIMAGVGMRMGQICTSLYTSPYPIVKVRNFPYPYLYLVIRGIPRINGDKFGQYPQGLVYFSSHLRYH